MAYTSIELSSAFPDTNDCLELKHQIDKLSNNVYFWRKQANEGESDASNALLDKLKIKSNKNDCDNKNNQQRGNVVNVIFDKYSGVDKIRIETKSIKDRNKRIFFGAGVLIVALGLILTYTRKK